MKRSVLWICLACVLVMPFAALGHHGQAAYDTTKTVTVKGTITDFQFSNPHVIVSLDAKDDKGSIQKWQGELTSPNRLVRSGWNSHSVKPGDEITITGYRAKNGATSMWITKFVLSSGEELKTGGGT